MFVVRGNGIRENGFKVLHGMHANIDFAGKQRLFLLPQPRPCVEYHTTTLPLMHASRLQTMNLRILSAVSVMRLIAQGRNLFRGARFKISERQKVFKTTLGQKCEITLNTAHCKLKEY